MVKFHIYVNVYIADSIFQGVPVLTHIDFGHEDFGGLALTRTWGSISKVSNLKSTKTTPKVR
jgi:hypothetical protein